MINSTGNMTSSVSRDNENFPNSSFIIRSSILTEDQYKEKGRIALPLSQV
jgi:hypothetical protein